MKFSHSLLGLLLLVPAARAKMGPAVSTKQVLANGKFLLVMLYPPENTGNKENALNKAYPHSGLYPNDGSNQPIWTLEQPFQGAVFLSADGNFLANMVFPADRKGDGVRTRQTIHWRQSYRRSHLLRRIRESANRVSSRSADRIGWAYKHFPDARTWHVSGSRTHTRRRGGRGFR